MTPRRAEPVLAYPERLKRCPVCGVYFSPVRKSAVYCSDTCRQKAFQDRKRNI